MTGAHEQLLEQLRPASFAVAYRMLGSVSEAEDVVQEALMRMLNALREGVVIESPRAYAVTVTSRLAIDELRSARARREHYVGEWLPEPLLEDPAADPAGQAELADSLSLALLVALESLSPEQRAVLLLHDVFDYSYAEVAAIVDKSETNVRQLASRARRHVEQGRPRFDASPEQRDALAERFLSAAREGDLEGLEELLTGDVVLQGDGGGKVPALARSLRGRRRVAHTLIVWARQLRRIADGQLRQVQVNGQPGALMLDGDGGLVGVWSFDIVGGQVQTVRSIINPDKLRHLGPLTELYGRERGQA
ncbi:MAG TPA: RNA polymerase sigma-70 factor [Solirubrobacteraceae bacterium]